MAEITLYLHIDSHRGSFRLKRSREQGSVLTRPEELASPGWKALINKRGGRRGERLANPSHK
jgi:hypothetical protein